MEPFQMDFKRWYNCPFLHWGWHSQMILLCVGYKLVKLASFMQLASIINITTVYSACVAWVKYMFICYLPQLTQEVFCILHQLPDPVPDWERQRVAILPTKCSVCMHELGSVVNIWSPGYINLSPAQVQDTWQTTSARIAHRCAL